MSSHKRFVGAAVGLSLFVLLGATLLSPAFGMFYGPSDVTLDQQEGELTEVSAPLYSNATTVDDVNSDVTLELRDTETGSTSTATISQGSSNTLSIEGSDVTVTVDNVTSSTAATVTYEYPSDYGWESGSSTLFGILPLFGIVVLLAGLAALGMREL